jgi:ammonia channel protein AmtB
VPGIGYFYGGITSKKNMLTMLMTPGLAIAVNSLQVWMGQFFPFEVDKINLNKIIYLQNNKVVLVGLFVVVLSNWLKIYWQFW